MTRFAFSASGSANMWPRKNLPRETEFVFEPAARPRRSAIGRKFLPEIIDLLLCLAIHVERDRFGELELRSAIERDESNAIERKIHRHHAALRPRTSLAVTRYSIDLRILKNAEVEFGRLLRFRIEP